MTKLNDRVSRLEKASPASGGVTEIVIVAVEPSPEGPRYTGAVLRMKIGRARSENTWDYCPKMAGQLEAEHDGWPINDETEEHNYG